MAIDWGSALAGAGSGALAGSAAGLPGIIVGGLGGLFSGILGGGPEKPPEFHDPYAAEREWVANRLITSNLGAKAATQAAGATMNLARDQMEAIKNNPNFASNAGALAGIQSKITGQAERGAASAYLQGAQVDEAAKERAAGILAQNSQMAQNQFMLNQAYKDRPSLGTMLAQDVLTTGAGFGLRKLFGNSIIPGGGQPDDTKPNQGLTIGDNRIASTQPVSLSGGQSLQTLLATYSNPTAPLPSNGMGTDTNVAQSPWVSGWGANVSPEWNPPYPSEDYGILKGAGMSFRNPIQQDLNFVGALSNRQNPFTPFSGYNP